MKRFIAFITVAVFLICALCAGVSASSLPKWYPDDTDNFVRYHTEEKNRVYDYAEVLFDYEEEEIQDLIEELSEKYGYDFIFITDDSLYGLQGSTYTKAFYEYCGFGAGDEYSGTTLFLCLEPGNQFWRTDVFGECETYYNNTVYHTLNELVSDDMNNDRYLSAVKTYIESLDELYGGTLQLIHDDEEKTSENDMPYWYPEDISSFVDFHAENAPRVVDDADMFTDEEEAEFAKLIEEIVKKYNRDFVLFTDMSTYGLGKMQYPADFYQFCGYGIGEDYTGSVLFICMKPGDRFWRSVAFGKSMDYFSETNVNSIDDIFEPYMVDGDYANAIRAYIKALDTLYEKGSIPRVYSMSDNIILIIVCGVIGLIIGGMVSKSQVAKMNKVAAATYANSYVVKDSFVLRDYKEQFLYKHVSSTYIPPSSSSSSGRSSYGGGSSSGGRSYSGGGRSF